MTRAKKKSKPGAAVPHAVAQEIRKLAAAFVSKQRPLVEEDDGKRPVVPRGRARAHYLGVMTDKGQFVSTRSLERNGYEIAREADGTTAVAIAKALISGDEDAALRMAREITEDDNPFVGSRDRIVDAPWNFELLTNLLTANTTHSAAIETKASDYAYSPWKLETTPWAAQHVDKTTLAKAKEEVEGFLKSMACGKSVAQLLRDVAIDYEAVGNGGFEILRDRRGFIAECNYIPFHTMRVLRKQFTKATGAKFLQRRFMKRAYFVDFNTNVIHLDRNGTEFDPTTAKEEEFPDYAKRNGHITYTDTFTSYLNAEEVVTLDDAANEFYMMTRPPFTRSTIYGTPSGITALMSMRAQEKIDQFNIQFFESKGVPQYAVVFSNLANANGEENPSVAVDGEADQMTESDLTQLESTVELFFRDKLAESDRNVLILELFGEATVKFEKLNNNKFEASFADYELRNYEKIRLSHRVPNAAIGMEGENAGLGGTRDLAQMRRYYEHIVSPGQMMLAHCVNMLLRCGLLIPYFEFKFESSNAEQKQADRTEARQDFLAGGIMLDEYRAILGKPPLPDGKGQVFYMRGQFLSVPNVPTEDAQVAVQNSLRRERKYRKRMQLVPLLDEEEDDDE